MDVTEPEIQRKVASWPFDQDKDTDVILTSCDNVAFYCHKLLLSLVSPVFNAMFTLPGDQSQELHDGRPCIPLAEADNDLYLLLSWCDPRCTANISSLAELEKMLELADKYGMECIVKRVEKLAVTMNGIFSSNPNPVELFFISARYRLDDLARIAATQTLDKSFEELIQLSRVPVAKHITAYFLQNLLQYHINCTRVATSVATDLEWLSQHRNLDEVRPFTTQCVYSCSIHKAGEYSWLSWWLEYMKLAADALSKRPSAATITSSMFLGSIRIKINEISCKSCRKSSHLLYTFNDLLVKEVRTRIKEETFTLEH